MKILGIIFCILFLLIFLFAKVKINGSTDVTIVGRAYVSFIGSIVLTLFLGLPILGIMKLLGL